MKRYIGILYFASRKHPIQIVIAIFLLLALMLGSFFSYKIGTGDFYSMLDWLDPILGAFTFLFAFFIWLLQLEKAWRDSLPKRMTVLFEHEGVNLLECREAFLSSESDIRTWGQQIGRQMTEGINLDFHPYIKIDPPRVESDKVSKENFEHHIITFFLERLPAATIRNTDNYTNFSKHIIDGKTLLWERETAPDGSVSTKKKWRERVTKIKA